MKNCFYTAGWVVLAVSMATPCAAAKTLTTYDQLLQAALRGDDVRAIVHFDKCTVKKVEMSQAEADIAGASTRINFTIFSHYKVSVNNQEKYTVATSNTILTEHAVFGPVYAYGRLRVFEDNTAEFHNAYFDPRTYEQKGMVNYICRLSHGVDQNGVELFDTSV